MTEPLPEPLDPTDGGSGEAADGAVRETLAQRVAANLRDMIVQDILPPGARVRERTLAQELDVSRTPMREALRILATERLVELLPNRGAVVADPSADEVHNLLSVLGVLESLAGEQAAANATNAEIEEINALHYEMLASFKRRDRLTYFKLNQAIHRGIVAASHNDALVELHAQVNARLYRVRYQSNLNNTKWHTAITEHDSILQALLDRDGPRLAHIMRGHLASTWRNVGDSIFRSEEPAAASPAKPGE